MILRLEGYSLLKILGLHTWEVQQLRHHLLVGNTDDDGSPAERVRFAEHPDFGSQKVRVSDLPLDHSPSRQPMVTHVLKNVPAPAAGDLDGLGRAAIYVYTDGAGP